MSEKETEYGREKPGIFSRLVEVVEDAVYKPTAKEVSTPPAVVSKPTTLTTGITAMTNSELDAETQELQQRLWKNISNKGPAYTSFVEMLESLKSIIPDEPTRYKAALAAVTKQGYFIEQIKKEIVILASSLDTENVKFSEDLKQEQLKLTEEEKVLPAKDEQISLLRKQIEETTAKLHQQINYLETEKARIRQGIEAKKSSQATVFSKFVLALTALKNELGNISINIQNLKGGN